MSSLGKCLLKSSAHVSGGSFDFLLLLNDMSLFQCILDINPLSDT